MKNNKKYNAKHRANDTLSFDLKTNVKQINNLAFLTDRPGK